MTNSKFKKRLVSACLTVALVASIGVLGVSANNFHNTSFAFTFIPTSYGNVANTEVRAKEDDSYSWMHCIDDGGVSYTAYVVASPSLYSNSIIDVNSKRYHFRTGTPPTKMINYVKENGYDYARIIAVVDGQYRSGTATGYWSPDYNPQYD